MSKQGRLRTQEMRRAQQVAAHKAARRRRILGSLGGLVILGLVVAIVVAVANAAGKDPAPAPVTGTVVVPHNLTSTGAIPVGEQSAPVTVEIYYDYLCPACGKFEAANAAELDRLVEQGVVRIEMRPIAFLDKKSNGTEYSTRTANAIATVANHAPEAVWDFHNALYDAQPAEGSDGLTDKQIASVARKAGVPADVTDRFAEGTYRGWVASVTQKAFASGVEGTPTVKVDGTVFDGDLYSTGPLTQAIESAAGHR